MEPLIVIKGAKKIIRNKTILHLDRFTADAGDLVTVVGESGAGKSTLLNILGLNDQFSSGQFYLFDQETKQLTGREKRLIKRNTISFLFQDFGLIEYETIDFNLDIGLKFSNLNVSDKRTAKYEALKKVNINKKLSTPIYTLSGGEKQRIACARVLLKNSKIILADEPAGSLDKRNKDKVVEILSQQASQGTLVIVVTHDPYLTKIGNKKIML
ncbi:ABC transporter ATP-binding protein [Enterococcus faecium]|uniref:ABC transporter ATP-binding protein n=1 Tax=Enterococcus faecium TaxID=1352 RepID=UPI0034E93CDA